MVEVVCAVIFNNKSEVLITQRGRGSLIGKWEFPGGKVENDESFEDSLRREIKEELNIDIEVISRIHEHKVQYEHDINLLFYSAKILGGIIALSEHQDYKWVLPKNLLEFDLLEGDLSVVEILNNGIDKKSRITN